MKTNANNAAENLISEGMLKLERLDFVNRFHQKDAALWKNTADDKKIIDNSLGWTDVYDWTLQQAGEIENFASQVKDAFEYVVVLGMGGSSLAPEVFRSLFGRQKGYPELIILDSTNADKVGAVRRKIKPEKTLFIFASKSGGTVEPASCYAYFYAEVKTVSSSPGDNFVAITDPGTGLEKLAKTKKFRKIFLNKADIGGRFSALSLFGMVPAALAGIDIRRILNSAKEYAQAFGAAVPMKQNPALRLGALIGTGALKSQDKMTLLLSKNTETFGLWAEQLVAESTGKDGKGVVPVAGESVQREYDYKTDRVFVHVSFGAKNNSDDETAEELFKSDHPVFEMKVKDLYGIGAQMYAWEIAAAAACALMGVNAFNQPNVEEAKVMAKAILEDLQAGKEDAEAKKDIVVSPALGEKVKLADLSRDIFSLLESDDYLALLAYLDDSSEIEKELVNLRAAMSERTKRAVLFGYGPRYLHSTGQLHKGGENNGVFLILSADAETDIKIPGQKYTFGELALAQALGDFKALSAKGRRVVKVHLKAPVLQSLKELGKLF